MSEASVEHSVDDSDESFVDFRCFSFARLLDVEIDAFGDGCRHILARIYEEEIRIGMTWKRLSVFQCNQSVINKPLLFYLMDV